MSELFEFDDDKLPLKLPLAARLSPDSFNEFVGQNHLFGEGKLLRRAVESDKIGSVIFFGPSGTGKTAAARLISKLTRSHYVEANAVTIGIGEIRNILVAAKQRLKINSKKTLLLLDEIHHFNRTQQDALLPDVERGNITLIGVTTENPFFYINSALLSRANVFEFKKLTDEDLSEILALALKDKKRGYGLKEINLDDAAAKHLIEHSGGDARKLLNALELAVETTSPGNNKKINITIDIAVEAIQKKQIKYDKSSDEHYDNISAFIKSMRGSDPDAALYWMCKMLSAGEDPLFIIRRVIICAAEDVGMADPAALNVATAALKAIEFVGMPEGRIPLSEAVIYVSTAPKSNASYLAISAAQKEVINGRLREVPDHLKDASRDSNLGHGKNYKYPHDFEYGFVEQEYMPEHKVFYEPKEIGYEREIKKRTDFWRGKKSAQKRDVIK